MKVSLIIQAVPSSPQKHAEIAHARQRKVHAGRGRGRQQQESFDSLAEGRQGCSGPRLGSKQGERHMRCEGVGVCEAKGAKRKGMEISQARAEAGPGKPQTPLTLC